MISLMVYQKIHQHDGKNAEAFAIYHEKRMIILYTYESDLGDGWEDQEVHNNSEKTREKALKMGANILDFVFTKITKVNIKFI